MSAHAERKKKGKKKAVIDMDAMLAEATTDAAEPQKLEEDAERSEPQAGSKE